MQDKNYEDLEKLAYFNHISKQMKKARKLAMLNKKVKILKAKFPTSLERIFYNNLVK